MSGIGTFALVALGGAGGACLRYVLDRSSQHWNRTAFPAGTLLVNALGSVLLGFVTGIVVSSGSSALQALLGTGFCGALTTYSTFGYETLRLLENRLLGHACANVALNLVLGFGSLIAGLAAVGQW